MTHLADLFVLPDRFGAGNRRPTARRRCSATPPVRTTFASSDPAGDAACTCAAGMIPLVAQSLPRRRLVVLAASVRPASAAKPAAARNGWRKLEQVWLGAVNRDDHRFWASLPDARPFVVVDGPTPDRRRPRPISPYAAGTAGSTGSSWHRRRIPLAVIAAAYHHAAEGGRIGSCLPGPSPALPHPARRRAAGSSIRTRSWRHDASLFDPTRRISDGGIR